MTCALPSAAVNGAGSMNNRQRSSRTIAYTVVVPAWNEAPRIGAVLQAVKDAQAKQQLDGDIVVVDNNSTDDTAAVAESTGATVVFEPVNQIARARNAGAAATQAEFLIFLDADTKPSPELFALTLEMLTGGEVIGGGSTMKLDRQVQRLAQLGVDCWNWFSVKRGVAAGCYIFCTREAFEAVGGFDERQYAAEEVFLSKAMRRYAARQLKKFVVLDQFPVTTSARKLDWYSGRKKFIQLLMLLIPGATRSKSMLGMWYDRSQINEPDK